MRQQLAALYELQTYDVQIARLNAQITALDGAKALRVKYSAAKKAFQALEKELTAYEIELKDNELKLKSVDEKRGTFEKRLYGGSVSNPKELGAIEKEIKMLKEQQGKLDPRVLELYDLVEAAKAKVQAAQETMAEAEKQARVAISKENKDKAKYEAELAELSVKREAAAELVTDKSIMSRYESLKKRNGSTGVAKIVENKCEGCHVAITIYTVRELIKDNELQNCENCGRMLLLEMQ